MNSAETVPCSSAQNHSSAETGHTPRQLFFWLLMAIGIYILSTGPVLRIAEQAGSSPLDNIVMTLYYPLDALTYHSPISKQFFDWYVLKVWRVH